MSEFEEISYKEYKFKAGDLVVIGIYGENYAAETIGFECAKAGENIVTFNFRQSYREKLEQKIKDVEMKGTLYIDARDDVEETTIGHIKSVCNDAIKEFGYISVLIDFPNTIDYKEDYIKQLKQLAEDLGILITICADIKETDTSPALSDLNNQALVDIADVIIVGTDEQATMIKNKYGKIGILIKEDDNNEK